MQHQAVLLIQQYTVLQVCQPAGERDILRRYNTTSGIRQSGARFKLHIFSGLQKSGTSGQKQLNTFICGAAIKRCDGTAGQSFNLSNLCRFTRKCIRFEHQFGMGILLSHAASIRPCRTCNRATAYECRCGPEAAARGGGTTKRDRVRRPATATHLHRMQPG